MKHPYIIERKYYLVLLAMLRDIRRKSHVVIYPPAKDFTNGSSPINLQEAIEIIDKVAKEDADKAKKEIMLLGLDIIVWSMNAFRASVGIDGTVKRIKSPYNQFYDQDIPQSRPSSSTPSAGFAKALPKEESPMDIKKLSLIVAISGLAAQTIDLFDKYPKISDQMYAYMQQSSSLIDSLSQQQVDKISGSIMRGVQAGNQWGDIADEIRKGAGICDRRARNIARDQTAKLNGAISRELNDRSHITHYIWRTAMDERVRPTHRANEGKVFSWASPPENTNYNHPSGEALCRCVAQPLLEEPFLRDNN